MPQPSTAYQVGWISLARYNQPLNTTDQRKWQFLTEHLASDIRVVGMSASWKFQYFVEGAHFYLLPYVPFAPLRYIVLGVGVLVIMLWLMVRHNTQMIVAQSPYDGAIAVIAIGLAKLWGKKPRLIVEAHDDFANKVFLMRRVPFEPMVRKMLQVVAGFAVRHADALRSVSLSTEKQLLAIAPTTPHVRFTAWTDVSVFAEVRRTVPLEIARSMVYVGVITPVKGIHILIEALAQLPSDVTLFLIGAEVAPAYSINLRQRIQTLGLEPQIKWLGKLSQSEVAEHVVNARLFVLPSQSEGLPRVIIEAMVCQTPVVASAVDGIPDIVKDGETGFLCPANDISALAQTLQAVLDADVSILQRITHTAQESAHAIFSSKSYLEGYRLLLSRASGEKLLI